MTFFCAPSSPARSVFLPLSLNFLLLSLSIFFFFLSQFSSSLSLSLSIFSPLSCFDIFPPLLPLLFLSRIYISVSHSFLFSPISGFQERKFGSEREREKLEERKRGRKSCESLSLFLSQSVSSLTNSHSNWCGSLSPHLLFPSLSFSLIIFSSLLFFSFSLSLSLSFSPSTTFLPRNPDVGLPSFFPQFSLSFSFFLLSVFSLSLSFFLLSVFSLSLSFFLLSVFSLSLSFFPLSHFLPHRFSLFLLASFQSSPLFLKQCVSCYFPCYFAPLSPGNREDSGRERERGGRKERERGRKRKKEEGKERRKTSGIKPFPIHKHLQLMILSLSFSVSLFLSFSASSLLLL